MGPSGIVSQLGYPALPALAQHPSSRNTVAKYTSQISADSSASDSSSCHHPSIQHPASGSDNPEERVYLRESIISLLLKLHSRFSGHDDSYRPPPELVAGRDSATEAEDCRIGDGSFWIAKVLDKLCRLDPRVRASIGSTRSALWPAPGTEGGGGGVGGEGGASGGASEQGVKEREKKAKIKERQQRLLQEFAHKQKQFMQQAMAEEMETDPYSGDASSGKTPPQPRQEAQQEQEVHFFHLLYPHLF